MTIYLDNAATTPVAPEVAKRVNEINLTVFGNPSSIHSVGSEARKIVDQSRRTVAGFIGCKPEEVIFTSGGSEGDNLAIRGLVESSRLKVQSKDSQLSTLNSKPHVITSMVEHHAVLYTVEELEKAGLIEATYVKPDEGGIISAESIEKEIKDNTVLVSIIYVNNETGVVSPIAEIGKMLKKVNESGKTPSGSPLKMGRVHFHTDAVQAAEFFNLNPDELGVDLLSLTAHKFHGPKGIGVLYVRRGTPIKSQITGGSHEFRLRAGTENVAGIAGLAEAMKMILSDRVTEGQSVGENGLIHSPESDRLMKLRDKLVDGIKKAIPETRLNGALDQRAPHVVSFSFLNAEGEAIILNLDFLGIAVSSSSACTSQSLEPSHVLSAMGVPVEESHGTVRISFGRYTIEADVDKVLEVLPPIINKLRMMSPFKK